MIIGIHQPAYLPWLGYFDKMLLADIFVILDTVQYEKNSFINRNRIKIGPSRACWLTVPMKRNVGLKENILAKSEIDNVKNWQVAHFKSIELNYKKTPFYNRYKNFFRDYYQKDWFLLNDLCKNFLQFAVDALGIKTKIIYASELPIFNSKKSDLILDICKYLNADIYISGQFGKDYLVEKDFERHNIKIYYQEFQHPTYPQRYDKFVSGLAIIDALFNIGAGETVKKILECNIGKEELIKQNL